MMSRSPRPCSSWRSRIRVAHCSHMAIPPLFIRCGADGFLLRSAERVRDRSDRAILVALGPRHVRRRERLRRDLEPPGQVRDPPVTETAETLLAHEIPAGLQLADPSDRLLARLLV